MIGDRHPFVVWRERIFGSEKGSRRPGVMDAGVEVRVVGDVDGFDEGGSGDGVEGGFGALSAGWIFVGVQKRGEGLAQERPGAMAEGHERVEDGGLASFNEGRRKQARCGAGVEVEEVGADGDAEVLLAFVLEGSVEHVRYCFLTSMWMVRKPCAKGDGEVIEHEEGRQVAKVTCSDCSTYSGAYTF